jgi:hypothetical protein
VFDGQMGSQHLAQELVPVVEAEVTLLEKREGGREYPLILIEPGLYRPHIVIGEPTQREAKLVGRTLVEEYLGVEFCPHPALVQPGDTARISMRLAFWPAPHYSKAVPGATFTIREGPKILGYGTILGRRDP